MNYFEWYWAFIIVSTILYGAIIFWFIKGWHSIPWHQTATPNDNTAVSVIIPFYNEKDNLAECVQQIILQSLKLSRFELLLVDDFSDDSSSEIAQQLAKEYSQIKHIKNTIKGKKQALTFAISQSKGELIITTDADCNHPKNWLNSFLSFYQQSNADLIFGPVTLSPITGFLDRFQYLDLTSFVGIGAGASGIQHPILCNGANLGFKKESFLKLNDPFNLKYESGDDVFLLHAMKEEKGFQISFLKSMDALVSTKPVKGLKAFFYQRQRWASKAKGYKDKDTLFTAGIVFSVVGLSVFGILALLWRIEFWLPLTIGLLSKTIIDLYFFKQIDKLFNTKKHWGYIPLFELFYVFYYSITAIMGLKENQWKRN